MPKNLRFFSSKQQLTHKRIILQTIRILKTFHRLGLVMFSRVSYLMPTIYGHAPREGGRKLIEQGINLFVKDNKWIRPIRAKALCCQIPLSLMVCVLIDEFSRRCPGLTDPLPLQDVQIV